MWGREGQLQRQASVNTAGRGGILQCGHGGPWLGTLPTSTEGMTEASKESPNLGEKNPGFVLY